MTSRAWYLALDQGGHASRAIVFDARGQLIAQAFAPIQTRREGEQVEHDAADIVQSLRDCVNVVAHQLGNDIKHIIAAGMATQRSSVVCWHRTTGAALSPVLSWQDTRQHAWLKQFEAQRPLIQATTGLPLSPHYGASKLRWCLDHLPAVSNAHDEQQLCMGPLSSYLLHALLTERPCVVDPSNASRTQLWSPAASTWSATLLKLFGVPRAALPDCVSTRHAYGHLSLGTRHIPLQVCTGDQAAVPFAQGKLHYDCIYLNIGTGAFALAPVTLDLGNAAPLLRSVLWSDASTVVYALEGTVNGAAAALTWYEEQFGADAQAISRTLTRDRLQQQTIPLFINGVGGVGSPFWLPQLNSGFIPGQGATAAQQVAAIIESIAFALHANLTLMRERLPQLQTLVLGGGLGQNQYLGECLADLTQLPVRRVTEPELTAKGLAYLIAAEPAEWMGDKAIANLQPKSHPALTARYEQWHKHMQALVTQQ